MTEQEWADFHNQLSKVVGISAESIRIIRSRMLGDGFDEIKLRQWLGKRIEGMKDDKSEPASKKRRLFMETLNFINHATDVQMENVLQGVK